MVLFAIPFMLLTNLLVLVAISHDNVWLLLPWMVLHCIVIAFLSLGAAILSAHGKFGLGSVSLTCGLLLLCCWKAIRQLFMKMVDRQLKHEQMGDEIPHGHGHGHGNRDGIEEDEPSHATRHRHELIFFGSKDKRLISHHVNMTKLK